MTKFVAFTEKQFHDLDDKLTEIQQGGGGGIADGSVTTAKLADQAVTTTKLAGGAVTWEKIEDDARAAIRSVSLVAADSQTDQALTALEFPHSKRTPAEMADGGEYIDSTIRLCWIYNGSLEAAPISFLGNVQTGVIALYARGYNSTTLGILGVDTSWTITALPTDGDEVSY